ncbi:MAG: hypothetical protein JAZ11_02625 [Candidatus Thiodiazotropha lotti]|nr:hypothetical protein [Candidatus Thiodiazotropha lotti]
MLKEFAVDPQVIASSFETCRYLISQFGADKGRLISKYPKSWKRMAIDAANTLPDGLKKERVVEYLNGLNNEWLTLIASNRAYAAHGDSWLDNARAAHVVKPFDAIICDQDDQPNRLIDTNACDESNQLFAANRICAVNRHANDLAQVATLLLQNCRVIRFIDPYFNPRHSRWRNPLAAMLALLPDITKVRCEYHFCERDELPPIEQLARDLGQRALIPQGGALRLVCWREKDGGERFHRRYLLTENAGLGYEGGLDESIGADQTTDVSLLDRRHHSDRWAEYNLDAQTYELAEPVFALDADGNISLE